jgi:uncharacterized protein YciI
MLELTPHLALIYDYVDNALEARKPFREAHLAAATAEREAGRLVGGGALGDPPHGGLLIFTGSDREAVEAFVDADPYVRNGVVTAWRIEPWNVVV